MGEMAKSIAVITEQDSDLLQALYRTGAKIDVIRPAEVSGTRLEGCDAVALLGGASDEPLLLGAGQRMAVENELRKGKKVFAEFVASIGNVYCNPAESTRYHRLACCGETIPGLEPGVLIDDQCGQRLRPHAIACSRTKPLLQYVKVHAHDRIAMTDEWLEQVSDRALWFEEPRNLLVCAFRLSMYVRARFSPFSLAKRLVEFVAGWLTDESVDLSDTPPVYSAGGLGSGESAASFSEERTRLTAERAMRWFEEAQILRDEGREGALEGLGTEVYPDGRQRVSTILRADCMGEIALAYYLHGMATGSGRSRQISDNLAAYVFEHYMCREEGPLYGMMRWTNEAWGVCYQDDAARAIIPQMLKCLYDGTDAYLQDCADILRFLVRTTGTDGTRVFRTDNIALNDEALHKLRTRPGGLPSAHYNAYYHAALFLAYKLTNEEEFLTVGAKGIETIMGVYPDTKREQSETEEYCRLILPLSWLYWATGDKKHKAWLYRVTDDLQRFKHASGGYLEWDSGYRASMRHAVGEGESSLIAKNGDPVVDLLYSNNWLPMAFMQAYLVTKDERFVGLWEESAAFMASAQLYSGNKQIDGAWARAFDAEKREVLGSPADAGWGPWAIESGWTVAEIASGLWTGLLRERLLSHY
jgi:hypothetical protein